MKKKSKVKIFIISPYLPKKDGIAFYTHNLYLELKKFTKCTIYKWNYGSYLNRLIMPVFKMPSLILQMRKFDIIHIQFAPFIYTLHLLPVFLFKKRNQKIILTVHEDAHGIPFEFIMNLICKIYFKFSHLIIFHTRYRQELNNYIKKSVVIPHGIVELNKNFKRKQTTNRQIFLPGFINPWKGHLVALKALKLVIKKYPKAKLIIAGFPYSKKYSQEIVSYVKRNNLESNVELYLKWVPDDMFENLMMHSEVVILPYLRSNMSGILCWTISFHAPAVVSNLNEFKELCGDSVLYARQNNPKSLAEQIIRLFESQSEKNKLTSRMKMLSHENNWRTTAEKTLNSYINLIKKN